MSRWPTRPFIYEINTWVWLQELGETYGHPVTLANVLGAEWHGLAGLCPDAV